MDCITYFNNKNDKKTGHICPINNINAKNYSLLHLMNSYQYIYDLQCYMVQKLAKKQKCINLNINALIKDVIQHDHWIYKSIHSKTKS